MHYALAAAEEEVLTWFDPTREPRIEFSRYVYRDELETATTWLGVDNWPRSFGFPDPQEFGDPLVLVVGSTQGLFRMPQTSGCAGDADSISLAQRGHAQPARVSVMAVFDSGTGERLVAQPLGPPDDTDRAVPRLASLRAVEAVLATVGRSAATPTSAFPGVSGQLATPQRGISHLPRLTWTNMPAPLAPTFRAYPFAPGTSWTWRFTLTNADVRWVAEIVTETVAAVWLDDDLAVVESTVEVKPITPYRNRIVQGDQVPSAGPVTRYVSPWVIAATREDVREAENWLGEVTSPVSELSIDGERVAMDVGTRLFPSKHDYVVTWAGEQDAVLHTLAGERAGCRSLGHLGGAVWGAGRWFCPGLGIVHYCYSDPGAMGHSASATADLIDYHIAELPDD